MSRNAWFVAWLIPKSLRTLALLTAGLVAAGCQSQSAPDQADSGPAPTQSAKDAPETFEITPELAQHVNDFCGACHPTPLASSFPKHAWRQEVQRGFDFFFTSERSDLTPPVFNDVVQYFEQQAPESIPAEQPQFAFDLTAIPFTPVELPWRSAADDEVLPAVAGMSLEPIGPDNAVVPVCCDMRSGDVSWIEIRDQNAIEHPIVRLENPARAHACDLDGDGYQDLLVADMGSFDPADHADGRVVWLRGTQKPGDFETIVLLEDIGRITDVRSGDFDQDGDLDLIVGEFGWLKTGAVWMLEQQTRADESIPVSPADFTKSLIDDRHGVIHVPVVDFDSDGDLDFVALFSQEHEAIELFDNQGDGTFVTQRIYAAVDPSYGSSGIELNDMDSDGDLDVLYVNGDTFDSYFIKPYHSIRWLENKGDFAFEEHVLGDMPGAQYATVGDADGDGDQDIVAVALMPVHLRLEHRDARLSSIILLENDGQQNFHGVTLEQELCNHASCLLLPGADGQDAGLLISNFLSEMDKTLPRVTFWPRRD